jgi:RimJ/RimL family protein N-acetyltransferase
VQEDSPVTLVLELRDGTPVLIRPIVPDDKERLRRGFSRLSAQSRIRRFGAPVRDLSAKQLRYLTEIDYENHMAWIALDPDQPESPSLGVARYVRLDDDPEVAEAAVVVADTYQGRGLGTMLLGMLGVAASTAGIRRFRAYVVTGNRPMLDILRELGGTVELEEPGLYRVDLPIPADPEELPDTPTGRVFKALAKRVLPPLAVLRRTVVNSRPRSR